MNLLEIKSKALICQRCRLSSTRKNVVFGNGNIISKIMMVGEAPGAEEDEQGKPFVGPAGNVLNTLLNLIEIKREDVYISNLIKCRPPQNRDPLDEEIKNCGYWLLQELKIIKPKYIIALGKFATSLFFPGQTIKDAHGTSRKVGNTIFFSMYHPAYAVHNSSRAKELTEDIKKFEEILRGSNGR